MISKGDFIRNKDARTFLSLLISKPTHYRRLHVADASFGKKNLWLANCLLSMSRWPYNASCVVALKSKSRVVRFTIAAAAAAASRSTLQLKTSARSSSNMMRMELHLSQNLCGQLFWIKEFMSVWAVGGRGQEPWLALE